jgi:hypothetical protein
MPAEASVNERPPGATGRTPGRLRDRLLIRVAFLLSLALLPIGILIVAQTRGAIDRSNEIFASTLMSRTSAIVAPEREAIHTSLGVARTLADALSSLDPDPAACNRLMELTHETNPRLAFVGFIETDRISRCNTLGRAHEFSGSLTVGRWFEEAAPSISFNAYGEISEQPVIIIAEPVRDAEGALRGYASLSFPVAGLGFERGQAPGDLDRNATVVTFNQDGEVLTASGPAGPLEEDLPIGVSLSDLVSPRAKTFTATTPGDTDRVFAVVPIVTGRAYALGSWEPDPAQAGGAFYAGATLGFPLMMWAVTMVVAVVSLNQLVLRHVKGLGRRMRSFADIRRIYRPVEIRNAPSEIRDIDDAFERMATQIIRDEANLENAVREREVLLKEVYHRVKNNLQLMSSIINMQARKVESDETRLALRQFQDRIASLAAVHRALYQEPSLTRLRVDVLLDDIVGQLATLSALDRSEVRLERDLEPVTLLPDQAGPLAMLVTEAMANAFKHGGPDGSGRFDIRLSLRRDRTGPEPQLVLEIENTVSPDKTGSDGAGLGRQLIAAFASQLEGRLEEHEDDERFTVRVSFAAGAHDPGGTPSELHAPARS